MPSTPSINSDGNLQHDDAEAPGSERTKRKHKSHRDGACGKSDQKKRRHSADKAARDPRDEPESASPKNSLNSDEMETILPSPLIELDGLVRPGTSDLPAVAHLFLLRSSDSYVLSLGIGTRARLEESPEDGARRLTMMGDAVRTILECVGEDPGRQGLGDTPNRYAKAMMFFTEGYQQNLHHIVNNAIFHEDHNEMVIVKDIEIFSMCEHHMVPFIGKMHIGYIPNHSVIGISKLPRIAEMFSRRLQIQERLTKNVADAVMEVLQPQGVAVVLESSHLCMVMRGVEKSTATTITSCVLGCFERNEKTRNEFLSLIGVNRQR